ncbi:MAG: hypothetical protein KC420_11270 [Myxococcales bacterium]|nr:hypothetical protein [Myxococcales bacterium]MCB9568311.1 hypothetical protein [Myxococcales bacterium]MCB9705035.1 hypothetical protein [Myxococcales bacterium]
MPLSKILLTDADLAPGEEKRILPNLAVSGYDRIHIHIGAKARGIRGLKARVLFASPIPSGALLSDSTIWYGESTTKHDFEHTETTGDTGFIMSVPVVAPILYDVILSNTSAQKIVDIYVSILAK